MMAKEEEGYSIRLGERRGTLSIERESELSGRSMLETGM
jgi:hypothetical protein